jgi:hypothetical protein
MVFCEDFRVEGNPKISLGRCGGKMQRKNLANNFQGSLMQQFSFGFFAQMPFL